MDTRGPGRYGRRVLARLPWLELAAWGVGVVLRLGLFHGFNPRMGYDTNAHTGYMAYVAQHGALPPIDLVWTANHPPLYYALCAGLHQLGLWPDFEVNSLQVLSVLLAIARLTVLWWGLRQVLPSSAGRALALALAGVLPCAVHGDGMVTNETLNGLAGTVAIIVAYRAFLAVDRGEPTPARWRWGAALAAALLVALLTKISGLLVAAAVAMGLGLLAGSKDRLVRAAPIAAGLLVALAISLPIYARHRAATGLLLPTSFERHEEGRRQQASLPPYFERRPASYYLGGSFSRLWRAPYYPTVVDQFPMVVLASTFTDYYNYSFVEPPADVPRRTVNHRPLAGHTIDRMRIALVGGLVLALALVAAYLGGVATAVRRWRVPWLVALAVPAAGLLGQMHYATKYPFDYMGLVKGLYLQFGWAPVFACFGAGIAWAWPRPLGRPAVLAVVAALVAVAQYSVHGVFEW